MSLFYFFILLELLLDEFDWHFQASVHFPLTSIVNKYQHHMRRIKPGAAGWEARMLPLCSTAPVLLIRLPTQSYWESTWISIGLTSKWWEMSVLIFEVDNGLWIMDWYQDEAFSSGKTFRCWRDGLFWLLLKSGHNLVQNLHTWADVGASKNV